MSTLKTHGSIELEVDVRSASESDSGGGIGTKHIPLSPPDSINSAEHTLKAYPEFHTHPILFQNLSSKQLYEHIETIVVNHVINHPQLSLPDINDTLHTLKEQLLPEHGMEIITESPKVKSTQALAKTFKWCTHSTRSLWARAKRVIPSSALLHHHDYSIDSKKYCGMLRGSVRQDWNTIETDDDEVRNWEELKPHWFELFFDLMFVAAIVHISSEVAEAYAHGGYMFVYTAFPQFGLLILCWLEQVLYQSRFRMTQTNDGMLRFFYMSSVLMMGLSIGEMTYQMSQKLFLLSYLSTKLIMCVMFLKSSLIPRAWNHSIYMIIENAISMAAVIVIEITVNLDENEYEQRQWIWCVIYSSLFVYSWFHIAILIYMSCIRDLGINIPINVPHVAERMGAFVLVIMGETIISIMVQHVESTKNGIITAYIATMSFFIIVYCIGKLYFESQPSEHELHHHKKAHAMSTSIWRASIYKWFHILLFFGLLGLGLGSKITVHELHHYHGDKPVYVFLPGISCIIVCFCINIIRLTHPFDYSTKRPHLVCGVWVTRVLCLGIMFAVLFTWQIWSHWIILAVYVLCFIVQIFVDFEAKHRSIITKDVDKQKSYQYHNPVGGLPKPTLQRWGSNISSTFTLTRDTRERSMIGAF